MDFDEVLDSRRSIRKFFPKPVELEKVGQLVHAASLAPSVGDLQPWKFIVVTKAGQLQGVADSCPYERWLYQAPLVIVICADHARAETFYPGKGSLWSSHSIAAAAQNILLTAVELDLAGCWVSSFETEKIRETLHIPIGIEPEIIIALGYPDEEVGPRHLQPPDMNTYFNDFGNNAVDVAVFKRDYGLYFRQKAEDVKTRLAYETAEKGRLRSGIENVQDRIKRAVHKITKKDKVKKEEEFEYERH